MSSSNNTRQSVIPKEIAVRVARTPIMRRSPRLHRAMPKMAASVDLPTIVDVEREVGQRRQTVLAIDNEVNSGRRVFDAGVGL